MISTTDKTCNNNSLVSSLLNNDTESSKKLKLIEFQTMNDDNNSQQKLRSSHLNHVPCTVSNTKRVERKSKRQRRTTSFYFEESLMMPSSRQSKFFQRPLPQATSSQMIWNQRLQQIQSVEGEPLVELKSQFSIHREEVSSEIRNGEENNCLDHPSRTISNLNISDSDIQKGGFSTKKSCRLLHRQSKISLKRANELPIVTTKTRQSSRESLDLSNKNTSFSVPVAACLHIDSHSLTTINPTKKLQSVTNTRRSSRIKDNRPRSLLIPTCNNTLEGVRKLPKSFLVPTTKVHVSKSREQNSTRTVENKKLNQSNKAGAFQTKAGTTATTRSSQRILNIRKQTDNENQISAENQIVDKCKTISINTISSRKEKAIANGESSKELTPGTTMHHQTRFFKDGWKVAGDPFPEERVCTGGYNVSFSVLLDRYDRNVKQGKYESVNFGPTIDTSKIAIASTMKALRARGIDESILYAEALSDDGHRVHKRSIAAFEDQERLERAREKESDFWAARRYHSKTHKKTKNDAEMIKIAKSPIVFEDDRQRRRSFSVCQTPCTLCHGSIESDLDPANLAHLLMPLYRPLNFDLTMDSTRCDRDNESVVRRRRSSGVSEKGIQTLMALKELSNTLEFIENYYAGYPKWGVTLQQSLTEKY